MLTVRRDKQQTPKIPLVFYRTVTGKVTGNEPAYMAERGGANRPAGIGADLQRVQYRWPVGMPLCRALGDGLWEVRTNLASRTISRGFICFHDGVLYALHGFIKKTQRTPQEEPAIARKRKREVEDG
jgi:phage-related protein